MGDSRYTGGDYDIERFSNLSQAELKEFCLRLFVDEIFQKNIITQYCSSPEVVYEYLDQKIQNFNLDYETPAAGFWDYNDININPNNARDFINLRETMFHEIMHAYTTGNIFCGVKNNNTLRGRGVNEGITEYISQQHITEKSRTMTSENYSYEITGTYSQLQIIAKQLCALLGEKAVYNDFFGNSPYANMYAEIDKYNIHNSVNFVYADNPMDDLSKCHIDRIYDYADTIYNKSNNMEDSKFYREAAFMSSQEELFKLMEQQIEYIGQPENYNEIETVKKHFIDFSKVSPTFTEKAKGERNLDINAMRDSLANTIANAYTRDEDKVDFKTGVISNNLEMDFESMSYQGLSNSDINIVFRNGQVFDIYSQSEAVVNHTYTLEEFKLRQEGMNKESHGMEEKMTLRLPDSTYKTLQSYLSKSKAFFPYSTINISNGLIVLNEGNKTVCFGYDNTGVLTPQDLESKKSFEGDIDLPTEFEKLPETIEPPKSIFEKIGDRLKSQPEEPTKPVQQQETSVSEPIEKGTLIDQIRGTAPKPEPQLKGALGDTTHSPVNQQLIDSIRGMSSEDYAKYQAEQETTPVKGKEQGPERGNSINKLNTNPGGMER